MLNPVPDPSSLVTHHAKRTQRNALPLGDEAYHGVSLQGSSKTLSSNMSFYTIFHERVSRALSWGGRGYRGYRGDILE